MKFVPNAVSRKVARQILVGRKHSPTILFGVGVVGVVATTVLASKSTLKLEEVLLEIEDDVNKARHLKHGSYSEEDRKKDLAVIYTKGALRIGRLYAPAVVVGVVSITALTSSHRILTKRNAALTAAYATLDKAFDEYRRRVIESVGEEEEFRIRTAAQKETVVGEDGKKETVLAACDLDASPYARFFDETCPSWKPTPEYNKFFLIAQQNYWNNMLTARGHVFLNEVYESLGFDHSQQGAVVGWTLDPNEGDGYIDFGFMDGRKDKARQFVNGIEGAIFLDFNVDGVIFDKI